MHLMSIQTQKRKGLYMRLFVSIKCFCSKWRYGIKAALINKQSYLSQDIYQQLTAYTLTKNSSYYTPAHNFSRAAITSNSHFLMGKNTLFSGFPINGVSAFLCRAFFSPRSSLPRTTSARWIPSSISFEHLEQKPENEPTESHWQRSVNQTLIPNSKSEVEGNNRPQNTVDAHPRRRLEQWIRFHRSGSLQLDRGNSEVGHTSPNHLS